MRELLVATGFSALVLVPFLLFVALGWPGGEGECVTDTGGGTRANGCYGEPFRRADIGKPGVRQPFNTWSNLYSLLTGGLLASFIYRNRRDGLPPGNKRMRSTGVYLLIYLMVVIFLGLGSMWMHASLVEWEGRLENLSIYTLSNFIVFYTVVRMTDQDWPFLCRPFPCLDTAADTRFSEFVSHSPVGNRVFGFSAHHLDLCAASQHQDNAVLGVESVLVLLGARCRLRHCRDRVLDSVPNRWAPVSRLPCISMPWLVALARRWNRVLGLFLLARRVAVIPWRAGP